MGYVYNEKRYERNMLNAMMQRTGKIDPRLFNNCEDAGDGEPGLQAAIRDNIEYWLNYYLHNGGMDVDWTVPTGDEIENINAVDPFTFNEKWYVVSTTEEFDRAITEINAGAMAAKITVTESMAVTTTINAPTSSLVIEGLGDAIILSPIAIGDYIITVTNCLSLEIKDIQLHNSFIDNTTHLISINEASDNKIILNNCYFNPAGKGGVVILTSDHIHIKNSFINMPDTGIDFSGDFCSIRNSSFDMTYLWGAGVTYGIDWKGDFCSMTNCIVYEPPASYQDERPAFVGGGALGGVYAKNNAMVYKNGNCIWLHNADSFLVSNNLLTNSEPGDKYLYAIVAFGACNEITIVCNAFSDYNPGGVNPYNSANNINVPGPY